VPDGGSKWLRGNTSAKPSPGEEGGYLPQSSFFCAKLSIWQQNCLNAPGGAGTFISFRGGWAERERQDRIPQLKLTQQRRVPHVVETMRLCLWASNRHRCPASSPSEPSQPLTNHAA